MSTRTLMTADELMSLPDDGMRHELIEGEITTMAPAGYQHGKVAAKLLIRVGSFVEDKELGSVYAAETGFRIATDPDTVRAPDLAFVSRDREPEVDAPRGFGRGAPDLAVEVISPDDSYEEVELKVQQWLAAGTRMVWVANPRTRTVAVHTAGAGVAILSDRDALEGGGVLPGFSCRIAEIFG